MITNLLTELARAVLGNIGPRSWQYGPSARLVSYYGAKICHRTQALLFLSSEIMVRLETQSLPCRYKVGLNSIRFGT